MSGSCWGAQPVHKLWLIVMCESQASVLQRIVLKYHVVDPQHTTSRVGREEQDALQLQ